ncbi:MAG: phage terminase large subunit [Leptolyngbyaceae cyanobacterium CSU_1_4]|nr:phage terminase large subunit [Leptolyngbyaceae cyanobacterium CSU_1_4]
MADQSRVKIAEKSRRVGLSWADAADAALQAAMTDGMDTWYIGFNKEMAEAYIKDVAFWAKAYGLVSGAVEEDVFEDEEKDILIYRVRFASGYNVTALSSRPANLRAKKGRIAIDEAAFHDDLAELLKAAIAILMWGGKVAIWSTHNGVDNHFNELIEACKAGNLNYSHHKITLDDALRDGLYQRICLIQGTPWTLEGEFEWRKQLYLDYGIAATEELDCEPFQAWAGKVFNQDWFELVETVPDGGAECRFWDLAATEADVRRDACLTSGVLMRRVGEVYYVLDVIAEQLGPAEANDLILETAIADGRLCLVRWELEGGSAGKRDEYQLMNLLEGFDAEAVKPLGDKVTRAKPMASDAKRGNVKLLRGHWNANYLKWMHAFPDGKIKDPVDASSGCYSVLESHTAIEFRSTGKRCTARASWF